MNIPPQGIRLTSQNFITVSESISEDLRRGRSFRLRLEPWSERRTLSQNALFHVWMKELSDFLIKRGRSQCSPEWCKDAMKFTFLGFETNTYTDVKTGAQIERESLRMTSKLRASEMHHFMTQVQSWSLDIGCFLKVPATSEFFELSRKQEE